MGMTGREMKGADRELRYHFLRKMMPYLLGFTNSPLEALRENDKLKFNIVFDLF